MRRWEASLASACKRVRIQSGSSGEKQLVGIGWLVGAIGKPQVDNISLVSQLKGLSNPYPPPDTPKHIGGGVGHLAAKLLQEALYREPVGVHIISGELVRLTNI